ncbi:MAG: peptidoglycan DD-metalloendopeptidase family protein [Candidatus Marinimicrobia bacterium]|jgi:urea transporter|nr:peptidoglycan DD-metalloendopeptidase family protein [Candidatus Neomarinimicrobiota bacterium]MBT3633266.1 peptidoglycan DD-metalloendopeptidase family protein [Candidatus Neomarinimicrobiota bacterium]MBT3682133.1 peptidoglycan DD-metalloendopeptidase family protein [Candidatus Neomarinimicrobiota bacterium]MBT3758866.1 peptidoglycan DD-metalloendopeptidase family protein [Candidatus Neomarinimicrobiota bacterium]MBT3895259.1 peptidoglycan DD-metalloendopeptidase family protein [Candidatus
MIEFFRICLKSYGIIAFSLHLIPSFILFTATFYNPVMGLMGLAGNIISNLTGKWLHPNKHVYKAGIFGINGILFGIALTKYAELNYSIIVFLLIGAILTGLITFMLSVHFEKIDLPVLSIPFTFVFWMFIFIIGTGTEVDISLTPIAFMKSIDLWIFNILPYWMFEYIKMFGSIFFQDNLISGFLVLTAIFLFSRISAFFGLWGGIIGMITYYFLNGSLVGFHGLNYVLIALAFGGFFLVYNRNVFLLATIAIIITGFVEQASTVLLDIAGLPVLVFPFNLVAILMLAPAKKLFQDGYHLKNVPVPLYLIKSPEANVRWFNRFRDYLNQQKTQISPPFLGEWTVLQGNNGEWTHKEKGKYAWDFVIRDTSGNQAKGFANSLEDYYAFGLPVLASAPGLVSAIENTIIDNPPGTASTEQNWGNYVIIDHQNGEFSEISHLKLGSVTVLPGQYVKRGQIIGYCGNSGRSPVPHIHYQLQKERSLGSETKAAAFSDGKLNDVISIHFNPVKSDRISQADMVSEQIFTLLGRESESWVYKTKGKLFSYKEILNFTTDEYGNPVISMKNSWLWHIIELPDFIEIKPDFKTYSSVLSPSIWMESIGEGIVFPKYLIDNFSWDGGYVKKVIGTNMEWDIHTNKCIFTVHLEKGIINVRFEEFSQKEMDLVTIEKLKK